MLTQPTDAVPKKRGPKTDVLEALLKRVDGLEAKLREKGEDDGSPTSSNMPGTGKGDASGSSLSAEAGEPAAKRVAVEARASPGESASLSPHTPLPRFVICLLHKGELSTDPFTEISRLPPLRPRPSLTPISLGSMASLTTLLMNPPFDNDFS